MIQIHTKNTQSGPHSFLEQAILTLLHNTGSFQERIRAGIFTKINQGTYVKLT